jgi:hypothetical protein
MYIIVHKVLNKNENHSINRNRYSQVISEKQGLRKKTIATTKNHGHTKRIQIMSEYYELHWFIRLEHTHRTVLEQADENTCVDEEAKYASGYEN